MDQEWLPVRHDWPLLLRLVLLLMLLRMLLRLLRLLSPRHAAH